MCRTVRLVVAYQRLQVNLIVISVIIEDMLKTQESDSPFGLCERQQ